MFRSLILIVSKGSCWKSLVWPIFLFCFSCLSPRSAYFYEFPPTGKYMIASGRLFTPEYKYLPWNQSFYICTFPCLSHVHFDFVQMPTTSRRTGTSILFFIFVYSWDRSRDMVVAIATGCRLDNREVRVRVPVGSRIFTSLYRLDRLWGSPNLLYKWYRGFFPGVKASGAVSWPLTSN
jgi:hypothetical protein